jgi:putative MFS transporter
LTAPQVAARLDRLPVTRFHYRFMALISLGAWFDAYDNFLSSVLVVALPKSGVVSPGSKDSLFSELGLFMAMLPLGMLLGSVFLGMASDYLGRRIGFIAMLLLYSLATLAAGVGYYPLRAVAGASCGFALLLVTRLLAGAGIGAENVIIDVYVSEVMPRRSRGMAVALTHAVAFTALPVVGMLGWLLARANAHEKWPWLLIIGSLGALFTWYFRRRLPESPRWSALMGKSDEAARTLEGIERAVEKDLGRPLPLPAEVTAAPVRPRASLAEIWSPRYRGRTLMLVVFHTLQTIGYYGFMHWIAAFVQAKAVPADYVFLIPAGVGLLAPVGPLLGIWSIERFQRKWLIVGLALMIALALLAFGLASSVIALLALGAVIIICLNWFSASFHAYQAELFPTEARATGVGFTYAWSRASMVVLNLLMPWLIARNLMAAFGVMAGAMVGVALVIGLFGPLTNARSLEELSPDEGA